MNDPFEVLSVGRTADKKEILRQVTVAMRDKRHDMRRIVDAQKTLFDPVARAAAEFRHFIDVEACAGPPEPDESEQEVPQLARLEFADEKGSAQS